ncbi:MAG: monofunctional biosynthetic peptidoglycan transglycosylase [Saprospiraceae bacterium]|nr:monofunctional biosynthetic peptidoglycan transglycosylase [Saprospiraceae bacterium]MCB9309814.1 monofunctional biosynthetic peptidoglycan transglycosylase [Lewinellaceae bacterium]
MSQFNLKKIAGYTHLAAVVFITLTVVWVVLYRFIFPPSTFLMVSKYGIGYTYSPKDLNKISPELQVCAMAAEDQMLPFHFGLDIEAIQNALARNKRSRKTFGASTITQQVAKNAFLFPHRNFIRKGFELYFTFWIETLWPKSHILATYLNIAEMGDGIFGAEAASQTYYKKKSSQLNISESAAIVASLPNPLKFNPKSGSGYAAQRKSKITQLYYSLDGRHYLRELYIRLDQPIYDFSKY